MNLRLFFSSVACTTVIPINLVKSGEEVSPIGRSADKGGL